MRWLITFGAASFGTVFIILLILWAMAGFDGLGLDTAGTVAIVFGALFTSALGVALMALIFYSDRSNADLDAYRATVIQPGHEAEDVQVHQGQNKSVLTTRSRISATVSAPRFRRTSMRCERSSAGSVFCACAVLAQISRSCAK